jgi:hypothetical protein
VTFTFREASPEASIRTCARIPPPLVPATRATCSPVTAGPGGGRGAGE